MSRSIPRSAARACGLASVGALEHRQHRRGRHDRRHPTTPRRRPPATRRRRRHRRATRRTRWRRRSRSATVPEDMSIVYVPGPDRQPVLQHRGVRRRDPGRGARHRLHLPGRPEFDVAKQSAIVSALIGEDPDAIMISRHRPGRDDPAAAGGQGRRDQPHRHRRRPLRPGRSWRRTSSPTTSSAARSPPARSSRRSARTSAATCSGSATTPARRSASSASRGSPTSWRSTRRSTTSARSTPTTQQAQAATIVSTTASSNDNLVGVYTMATNNTEGAVTGLREAGMTPDDVRIVGYDVSEPILQALEDGDDHRPRRAVPVRRRRPRRRHGRRPGERPGGAARPADRLRVRHAGELGDS